VAGNQERFQELRRGIARSGSMIAQMLRLARADASLQTAAVTRVDVSEVVVAAVAEVLPIAMKRNIDIGAQEMASAKVRVIEADLGIAIRNLVSNAIRYTPDGGKVDLRTEVRNNMVWIEVIDTGPGIAEDLLPRIRPVLSRECGNRRQRSRAVDRQGDRGQVRRHRIPHESRRRQVGNHRIDRFHARGVADCVRHFRCPERSRVGYYSDTRRRTPVLVVFARTRRRSNSTFSLL
jgi:histidine kinase/DNA gyrase B/HSP90-like ATPase